MDPTQAGGGKDGGWIPADHPLAPEVTIREQATGFPAFEVDPAQLPTETIARGGRRIYLDAEGNVQDSPFESRADYELLDKISEGGMGIVFRVQEKSLRREVALKICRAELKPDAQSTLAVTGEFTNEAYMTAQLDHPGVVPIYALAKDADGRPFFAMKRIAGISWKDLLHPALEGCAGARARQMTWKDHLEILLKVCDAVAYAHSKAILHRDLKPENILLGDYGEVYVMDWGLALYFDDRNEYRRFPGLKPQLAGTPSYIAPEMVRGEMTRLGPATDVYLLGGMLYEILTGRPPHDGRTVMEVLRQAATGVVTPPEETGEVRFAVPELTPVVMKALAPRIADRYPTVASFQQALRGVLVHAESLAVGRRAAELLAAVRQEQATAASPAVGNKEAMAVAYSRLSECIGGFRQAIALWTDNPEARQGLLEALATQIQFAVQQDDLTFARAQFQLLDALPADDSDPARAVQVDARRRELARQIQDRQARLDRAARQVHRWRTAAVALGGVVLAGIAAILVANLRARARAVESEMKMFAASVDGRAQMLDQLMFGIEQVATLYRQAAVDLLAAPASRLPWRTPTPAGRDGFYYDEDFYDPATRPPGMVFSPRYQADVSMDFPTVVRAPWARTEPSRAVVEDAAARLGRLNTFFSNVHRTRREIQWSIAATEAGVLAGFPGFGRYRDKSDYDPTRHLWYQTALNATRDFPVWGHPHPDASTGRLLMSCLCRLHVEGRNVGAVGVEITLESLQKLLLDFSQALGGQRRALLIRALPEKGGRTGRPKLIPRIVVDTRARKSMADWQESPEMPELEAAGPDIAAYYQEILDGQHAPGTCQVRGDKWLAYAPVQNRRWILLVILERGPAAGNEPDSP